MTPRRFLHPRSLHHRRDVDDELREHCQLLGHLAHEFGLSALVLFTAYSVRIARREITGEEKREFEAEVAGRLATARGNAMLAGGLVVLGIVLLVVGGHSLVTGAVSLASGAMDFKTAIERLTAFWQAVRSHQVMRSDWRGAAPRCARSIHTAAATSRRR